MKTNNKNVVRLTESQLKAMVAESVREALNEYYVEDYYGTDDYYLNQQDSISKEIFDGRYDDKLFDDRFVNDLLDDFGEWGGPIENAIEERRKEISKDYAMEYGYKTYNDKDVDNNKNYWINDYLRQYGINSNGNPKLSDDYWKDHDDEESIKPIQNILMKKNGKPRSTNAVIRNLKKEFGWQGKVAEKPLHRKGSMNRDLMNIDKQNESRLYKIVSESIDRVLKNK